MYLMGDGVEPDPVQAWLHYEMGLALGNKEEGWLRQAIESQLSPAALEGAQAVLADWKASRTR